VLLNLQAALTLIWELYCILCKPVLSLKPTLFQVLLFFFCFFCGRAGGTGVFFLVFKKQIYLICAFGKGYSLIDPSPVLQNSYNRCRAVTFSVDEHLFDCLTYRAGCSLFSLIFRCIRQSCRSGPYPLSKFCFGSRDG